jgi:nucleoside-diphosphate-sugar epimerase
VAAFIPAKDWIQTLINTEDELIRLLTKPSAADIEAAAKLDGDLILLGAGGKMGPTLALRARRAAEAAGVKRRIIAVSRFTSESAQQELVSGGVEIISCDLLDRAALASLPDVENVIYLAGRKFGSTGGEAHTWAMNVHLAALVAERFRESKIVAFSSGNVYPFVPVTSGGATESTPPGPVGEYAQSVLGRERMFEYFSGVYGIPTVLLRLNYAAELRYGVLLDLGNKVFAREPVDVTPGMVNVIWQGDANSICLRSFGFCQSPPAVLNLTGPEILSVRQIATRFGELFSVAPTFTGVESNTALLNNAARCHRLFGYPSVSVEQMIAWTAHWIGLGGSTHAKPTHFEVRDGKF